MGVSPRSRPSRETRLLLIVITLSAVVLVALSQFRFPDEDRVPSAGATPLPLERLAARELVLIRVPHAAQAVVNLQSRDRGTSAPRYVAAVEGTRGGAALRPVFLGRTDPLSDDRYEQGLIVLGGVLQASPGSLIFALDGSFVGLCIIEEGFAAGVPGPALDAAIERMLRPQ